MLLPFEERNKTESFYHAALIQLKKLNIATISADNHLRSLLEKHSSFEAVFESLCGSSFSLENILTDHKIKQTLRRVQNSPPFQTLTINNPDYPLKFGTPVLYAQGDISLLKRKGIAIVGTRQLNNTLDIEEGRLVTERTLKQDYVIVSGLALGCDTLAHVTTLYLHGKTIAVLGTPLDKYYPSENKDLQEKIAHEGLVLSQYPIGINTFPSYFAHRNKTTVSLASEGVIVIRAGEGSGTLHAVRECLAQNKPLYVLENNLSQGYDWVKKHRGQYRIIHRRT